jgi:uncharacterized membrane protein
LSEPEFVVLRLLHILPGAYWVGASVFLAFILEPTLTAMGPSVKGPVMARLSKRIAISIFIAAVTTIVAGIVLAIRVEGTDRNSFDSAWGVAILLGLIASVLALTSGAMTGETVKAMAKIGAAAKGSDGPPPPEVMAKIQALGNRLKMLSRTTAVLTVIAVGTMASARFV